MNTAPDGTDSPTPGEIGDDSARARLLAAAGDDWSRWDQIALTLFTLVAGVMRIYHLSDPDDIMFDETYYAKDACWYIYASPSVCEIETEQAQVHPPLAKWIMAVGIRIFGYESFGWRIASVVAGTLTVALFYLVARKLLRSTIGASVATGLLAFDFLHFVQSRIAMVDVFVPLFGTAALLFLLYDRDRILARAEPAEGVPRGQPPLPNRPLDRPWRLFAGIAGGAAVSSKWSGGLVLVMVIGLTILWEIQSFRKDGKGRAFERFLRQESSSVILWLFVLPVVLYVFTYVGRIHGDLLALPWSENSWVGNFIDHQRYMADFHRGLEARHPYQSPPWSWILLKRPVSYFFCSGSSCSPAIADNDYKEIFAAGSPLVWLASIPAVGYVAWRWIRTRRLGGVEGIILAGVVINYGPWLLPWFADRSAVFIFYLLPVIPFMCLALGYVAARMWGSKLGKAAVGAFSGAALALFIFYYPLLGNVPISQQAWDARIWVFDDCEKPPGYETTSMITETSGTNVITKETTVTTDADLAPIGWCWI